MDLSTQSVHVRLLFMHNDQVHRARGPMGFTFEQSKSVNEGEGVEKPKDERSPVRRLVIRRLRLTYPLNIGSFTEFTV